MSRVPGTFKARPGPLVERRVPEGMLALIPPGKKVGLRMFDLGECKVLVGQEPLGQNGELRWHLSISHASRYPTWDEIKTARYELTPPQITMVMFLPPAEQYVNVPAQDNVFHLHEIEATP